MLCALIMAGGIGSRFWPQSTVNKPKQFLNLINDKTMIQLTYERINKMIPKKNIFIVTNKKYIDLIKEQLPDISDINIITEPCSRNTAPCILLSSLYIKKLIGDTNIICIPSDSYVEKEDEFLDKIKLASNFVNNNKKAIVTIGITPTRAETGYGYIKYDDSNIEIKKVIQFVEKPSFDKAKEYFMSGKYLWNAGMFIFNNINLINEIRNKMPQEYLLLKDLPNINDINYYEYLNNNYEKCQKISIDYAIIEKSSNIYTIPSNIGWDDVGTWKSLERYINEDENRNVCKGNITLINSSNNVVYGNNKKIVLLNVDDLCCIDSDEVIVVGKREDLAIIHTLKDK